MEQNNNSAKIYTNSLPEGLNVSLTDTKQIINATNNKAKSYEELALKYKEEAQKYRDEAKFYAEQTTNITMGDLLKVKDYLQEEINTRQPIGEYALVSQLPENVSELNNDSEYATVTQLDNLLPPQADCAGKFLKTDGENLEWGSMTGCSLFDTKLSDRILDGDSGFGWALQGTYTLSSYTDFYRKCLEEYQNSNVDILNVNIIGKLTNNKGVLSGFSTANYAKFPSNFQPSNNIWEIVFKIRTSSDVTTEQYVFSLQNGSTNATRYATRISMKNGLFCCSVTYNGTAWDIVDQAGTFVCSPNTDYYVKLEFTGNSYIMSYSLDGKKFNHDKVLSTSIPMYNACSYCVIGLWNNGATIAPWLGSIDLNESYININGKCWWKGGITYKNSNGHVFYDISNKGFIDEIFNSTGSAWCYGIDTENQRIFLPRTDLFEQSASDSVGEFKQLLYICVGNTMVNQDNVDVAKLTGDIQNKVDTGADNFTSDGKNIITHYSFPSEKYIDLTLGASGTIYTAPADGWLMLYKSTTGQQYISMSVYESDTDSPFINSTVWTYSANGLSTYLPVSKGQKIKITYAAGGDTAWFRFCFARGAAVED